MRRISHNPTRFVPERRRLGDSPARRHRVGEAAALPSARLQPAAIRTVAGDPRATPPHVCSMFARLSRYGPVADGITRHTYPGSLYRPAGHSISRHYMTRRKWKTSRLLICGFGVQVPGGAPILTWDYTRSGSPRAGRFGAMFAPRLLVSPDLVAGTAPISWHGGRVWARWSRPFARMPGSLYPTDVATQRDTSWQADG